MYITFCLVQSFPNILVLVLVLVNKNSEPFSLVLVNKTKTFQSSFCHSPTALSILSSLQRSPVRLLVKISAMLHIHTALKITATITRNQLMNKVSCQETHFQHCCTLTHSITQGLKMTFTYSHNLVIMHPFCLVIVQSTNMTITFCLVVVIMHVFLFSYSLVDKSPKTLVNQSYLVIFQSTKTTLLWGDASPSPLGYQGCLIAIEIVLINIDVY